MRPFLRASIAALLLLTLWPEAVTADSGPEAVTTPSPVVVELFTSQGCNSCPPADALLAELARRPDLVALSLHVDYWDYIGWKDPFGDAAHTARQRAYAQALGLHMVYTPQMVIDGVREAVGSDRRRVEAAIAAAAREPKLPLRLVRDRSGGLRVVLPENPVEAPATVWLVLYDSVHETPVRRGENAGQTLRNVNVVRAMRKIGEWTGAAAELPLALDRDDGYDSCAVMLQAGPTGPVLGAVAMRLPAGS